MALGSLWGVAEVTVASWEIKASGAAKLTCRAYRIAFTPSRNDIPEASRIIRV